MTNIVVLDGETSNPGDLSWSPLKKLGDLTLYDRTSRHEVKERLQGCNIALTNKVPLDPETISCAKNLEFISTLATGFDVIDLEAARNNDIPVSNVPEYSTRSVAEHTFGLIFELTHRIGLHNREVHSGAWNQSRNFTFWRKPLTEIAGKTIGLIGFGRIGRKVADAADAFGMNIVATTKDSRPTPNYSNFELVSTQKLLQESDIVSLHLPLNNETHHLIGEEELNQMKDSALLINTARGEIIDESALAEALKNKTIKGAGIDVASQEPPPDDFPLLGLDNCIITPHIAWTTQEARQRLLQTTAANIEAYLEGEPINVVN